MHGRLHCLHRDLTTPLCRTERSPREMCPPPASAYTSRQSATSIWRRIRAITTTICRLLSQPRIPQSRQRSYRRRTSTAATSIWLRCRIFVRDKVLCLTVHGNNVHKLVARFSGRLNNRWTTTQNLNRLFFYETEEHTVLCAVFNLLH